jgi:hypothetical protein
MRNVSSQISAALAASALLSVAVSGCTHSSDPGTAPYGTAATTATPSAAPSAPPLTVLPNGQAVAVPPGQASAMSTTPPSGGAAAPAAPPLGGPMMGGMGASPTAPLTPTPELDSKVAAAEKSGSKPAIGAAYAERGSFRMNDANAGARVKYRAALDDYRKALAADPSNAEAKQSKALIEGIYKQMGRPIPGA